MLLISVTELRTPAARIIKLPTETYKHAHATWGDFPFQNIVLTEGGEARKARFAAVWLWKSVNNLGMRRAKPNKRIIWMGTPQNGKQHRNPAHTVAKLPTDAEHMAITEYNFGYRVSYGYCWSPWQPRAIAMLLLHIITNNKNKSTRLAPGRLA